MMNKEDMLLKQRTLVEACEYLDMRGTRATTLSMNTNQDTIDLENYNALLDLVTARLSRQMIMSKRHLDRLV